MINFFKKEEEKRIIEAIKSAEKATSGEIRVHLDKPKEGKEILDVAADTFHALRMDKTEQRNGVLFYLVPARKQFAIIGDKGINEKVPPNFWDEVRDVMQKHFREAEFTEGLCQGIERVGEKLHSFFPYQSDDKNELSDDISYGS